MPKNTMINLPSHDNITRKRGEVVYLYKSRKCPCGIEAQTITEALDRGTSVQDAARSDVGCPVCRGNGVYWLETPEKVKALIADVNMAARQLLYTGIATPGDLVMSPPPLGWANLQINDLDKIILRHRGGQQNEGDLIKRGQYHQDFDFAAYPIVRIEAITWISPASPTVPITCVKDVDYTFTMHDRKITWLGGPNQPPLGAGYALSYFCHYEWIALVSPFTRVENGVVLGPKVLLKKRHVIGLN